MLLATDDRSDESTDGCGPEIEPSIVVATVVVMVSMPRRRGRWTMVTAVMNGGGTVGNAGTAMRCRKAGSRQGKSGHEGHEEFLVVRVITILFLPA